jgi:hypothetical protein
MQFTLQASVNIRYRQTKGVGNSAVDYVRHAVVHVNVRSHLSIVTFVVCSIVAVETRHDLVTNTHVSRAEQSCSHLNI